MRPDLKTLLRRLILFSAWSFLLFFFYSVNSGITCTNDGGHFALISALIEQGSAELKDEAKFAGHDIAVCDGKIFPGRDPGLGFLGFLFYRAFEFLLPILKPLELDPYSREKATEVVARRIALLMLIPPLLSASLYRVLYHLFRFFDFREAVSLTIPLLMIFSTLLLRYSALLYSHILAALLVACFFLNLFRSSSDRGWNLYRLLAAGFFLASGTLVEPLIALVYLPACTFLCFKIPGYWKRPGTWIAFLGGGTIPFLLLAGYNTAHFDNPFFGAYFHHATFEYAHSLTTMFNPLGMLFWLKELLFSTGKFMSLLGSSWVMWMAILAIPHALRADNPLRKEYLTLLAAFGISVAAVAVYKEPWGGYDWDHRYFLFTVPLLFPLVALPLEAINKARWSLPSRITIFSLYAFFFAASIWINFRHLRHDRQGSISGVLSNLKAAIQNTAPFILLSLILLAIQTAAVCLKKKSST